MALRSDVGGSPSIGSMDPTFTAASILAGTANGNHGVPRNESSDRSVSPGGSSQGDGGEGGPPKKKKRRRRSAITGTLYFADDEPDPDAGLDPSRISDTELKKSKGLDKKFPCDWPGCDKTFSRPDHLSQPARSFTRQGC